MPDHAEQIAAGLGRVAVYWRAAAWKAVTAAGLNPTQAEILAYLSRRGPTRQGDLASVLGVSPASLSDSVASLNAKGMIRRRADPQDRRVVQITLSDLGKATQATLPEAPEDLLAALCALPAAEAGSMLRALTRIIRALQEARAIPVQRICATCQHFRPHVHDDAAAPHHCAFVDAAFGDANLRLDCAEHEEAADQDRALTWARFDTAA